MSVFPPDLGAQFLKAGPRVEDPVVTSVQPVQANTVKSQAQLGNFDSTPYSSHHTSCVLLGHPGAHLAWTSAAFSCAKAHTRSRCP